MKFLIYTNILKFWNSKKPIILAGDWCLIGNENIVKDKQYEKIEPQWKYACKVVQAEKYCNEIYEKVLEDICNEINKELFLNKNKEFYRIIIGYWLLHFVHQAYDKFLLIHDIKKKHQFETVTLSEDSYTIPEDLLHYNNLCLNHLYQAQLFSQIIKAMGINNSEIISTNCINLTKNKSFKFVLKSRIKKVIKLFYNTALTLLFKVSRALYKKLTIINNPYFKNNSNRNMLKIFFKSKGRIIFDFNLVNKKFKKNIINKKFRNRIYEKDINFDSWITNVALSAIPKSYLENFKNNLLFSKKYYKELPLKDYTFFTLQSLYTNTTFQYFIAENRKKINIYSGQHGCAYGIDIFHTSEKFDRSIVDKFFTYGWVEDNKTHPLPMPLIINTKINLEKNKKILILISTRPVYLTRLAIGPLSSINNIDHVEDGIKLINNIEPNNNVVVRYHPSDKERWNNQIVIDRSIPNLKIDTKDSFYSSLAEARILVSDCFATTTLEGFQANVPSIIYINKDRYLFRNEFSKYVKKMEEVGILFYSPDEAAKKINEIYDNVDEWWNSSKIQMIRRDICDNYALTDPNWINEWSQLLTK